MKQKCHLATCLLKDIRGTYTHYINRKTQSNKINECIIMWFTWQQYNWNPMNSRTTHLGFYKMLNKHLSRANTLNILNYIKEKTNNKNQISALRSMITVIAWCFKSPTKDTNRMNILEKITQYYWGELLASSGARLWV